VPYPVASTQFAGTAPNPAYSGVFIPTIWSGKLVEKFYDATVLAAISNTDYEGEIKNQGDTINIRTKPTITIRSYQSGQALAVDRPSSSIIQLTIDQGNYFNLALDDVMEVQSDMNLMSMWADDASEQMKIIVDRAILATLPAGIVTANKGATAGRLSGNVNLGATGSPVQITTSNVLQKIIELGQVLDEQNQPETGRWLVVPPWFASVLKQSPLQQAYLTGDSVSPLRNGRLGMIDRFTIYSSNLLPTATETSKTATHIFAGTSHGLTFATQFTNVESMRSESSFSTLLRGLQIYGSKVIDGAAIADLYVVQ
jgi:hypothetical protein